MAEIRIIGARQTGKTTYLATLAACPHKEYFPGLEITPIGDDSKRLVEMAWDIIAKYQSLPPTRRGSPPEYELEIKFTSASKPITLLAKDYAGELFEELVFEQKDWSKDVREYVNDLLTAQGWMIVLTDWQQEQDTKIYQPAIKNLLSELNKYEAYNKDKAKKRIAVVMTKCERGEIWAGRFEPGEDLFKVRLPKTYEEMMKPKVYPQRVKFFACSSFGVLGDKNPRPNRYVPKDGSSIDHAYLRDNAAWQPYGLFAPIYWLNTGNFLSDNRL